MRSLILAASVACLALTAQPVFANENQSQNIIVQPMDVESFRLKDLSAGEKKFAAETTLVFEGIVTAQNQFVDHDLFEQISGAVAMTELTVQLTDEFGLTAWSVQSLNPDVQVGDELYVAAFYETEVTDELALQLEVGRSFNRGFNHMWLFTAGVEYNDFDLSITQFVVDNGPRRDFEDTEDATRIQFGYAPELLEGVVNRVFLTHETGFGLPTITTLGLQVEVSLNETWSLRGEVITPIFKEAGDDRKTAVMVESLRSWVRLMTPVWRSRLRSVSMVCPMRSHLPP